MSPRTEGSPETSAPDLRDRLATVKRLAAEGDSAAARAMLRSLASPDDDFVTQARLARVLSSLPSAGLGAKPLRIAILAASTVDHFADVLRFWLALEGFAADLWIAPFDTIIPSALDVAGPLYAFAPDLIWLFTSNRDVRIEVTDDRSAVDAVAAAVQRTQSLWEALRSRRECTILQNNADIPAIDGLGNFATQTGSSRRNLLRRYNLELAAAAPHGVVLFDLEHLSALHGKARWNDGRYWYHSKHAFAPDSYGRVAFQAARLISALAGKARKCLIVDLDNTLWGGTIGDDGLAGLQLGSGADGEAFVDFQRWLVGLKERGVILAVCSKNEEDAAKEPFLAHPDCVLRLEDFAMFRANWNSKANNICDIANALNIGLDSLVFVDDSPLERDAVRSHLPEVAVPELPADPAQYIEAIDRHGYFETVGLSAEDRERTRFYRENAARAELQGRLSDIGEYLGALGMVAEVADLDAFHLPRMAQLINKSNQFHLTGTRYTEAELARLASQPGHVVRYVKLRDRIGDNGLIAVIVLVKSPRRELLVETWVMSCRVLGRTLEEFICNDIVETARRMSCRTVVGRYVPGPRNRLVAGLYERLGFRGIGELNGGTGWSLAVDRETPALKTHIESARPSMEGAA